MRVIAGIAKKRRLKSPGKLPVRPTSDRVKEALFNIISDLVAGSSFADLYAGTGGVGIEALSRGAGKVVFVESDPRVVALLRENLQLTGLGDNAEVVRSDVGNALYRMYLKNYTFNIIFADPPYRQGLAAQTLNMLTGYPVLHQNGIVILETGAGEDVPVRAGALALVRREKYGDTTLAFYKPIAEEDQNCE